ncbi:hypothetical protein ACOALZ_00470 [Nocardiopsis algeriensis]|uniref:hypothetical protein n=1 Tax=Nocardiopsis algeriensis TaxID=1478215 RepID=UPI003B42EFC0
MSLPGLLKKLPHHGFSELSTLCYSVALDGKITRLLYGMGRSYILHDGNLAEVQGCPIGVDTITRLRKGFLLARRASRQGEDEKTVLQGGLAWIANDSGVLLREISFGGPFSRLVVDDGDNIWVGYSDSGVPLLGGGGDTNLDPGRMNIELPGVVCWNTQGKMIWKLSGVSPFRGAFLHCHAMSSLGSVVMAAVDDKNSLVMIDRDFAVQVVETPVIAPLGVVGRVDVFAFIGRYFPGENRLGFYRSDEFTQFEKKGSSAEKNYRGSLTLEGGGSIPGVPQGVFSSSGFMVMNFGNMDSLFGFSLY